MATQIFLVVMAGKRFLYSSQPPPWCGRDLPRAAAIRRALGDLNEPSPHPQRPVLAPVKIEPHAGVQYQCSANASR